ncbi:LOW QUALITY PROTEIN: elongation of fatty acids protein 3-like [Eucalyptus grandis]|uniref:LOW QUALITY PROTEIN: elongation of fatty acids protein 3-like n=1 Tax=Eucalyptus grandis TaxID=71139 RepID=UPI00192EA88C|nr:LOW QUALITY PROTEIN: elongation of fatty acids protein 3-like [Eucalyptus grandis]
MGTRLPMSGATLKYYLSEHPAIVNFRWSHHLWGSTWSFLAAAVPAYVAAASVLHLLLPPPPPPLRRRPVPLGPLPALHSLAVAAASAVVFAGMLLSASAEIRDTRWLWRRSRTTPIQWLLCFPLGTRPSGRVFFWSYAFYLSRFLHLLRTFLTVLRRRRLTFFQLFNQSILLCMSFLWLEFSQSFQVLAILSTTLLYAVVYGYRFWTAIGLPGARFPFVANCQVILLCYNLLCHFGVLLLHFWKGGCNGIGAWVFNSVLNGAILYLVLKFYVKVQLKYRKVGAVAEDEDGSTGAAAAAAAQQAGSSGSETKVTRKKDH